MAKILSFRAKTKAADGSAPEQDFLHHEDHTLSFQVTETGGPMVLGNLSKITTDTPEQMRTNDWSNQELADLYRVKGMLDAAGVPNELDRGLTDEGDPWLVFCGADGEVFIHLCRMDGLYVLDSPNIKSPLRGADFNALIESFTQRSLPRSAASEADTDSRVIRIKRGGKVHLHPSALLAALIWTLFLAAEELVLRMPDKEEATDGLADLGALGFDGDATADTPLLVAENNIPAETFVARTGADIDPRQVAAQEAFLRDNANGLTATQNSYGMGLSTIAIAFGFMAEQVLSDNEELLTDDTLMAAVTDVVDEENDSRVVAEKAAKAVDPDGTAVEMATTELAEADTEARSHDTSGEKGALDAAEAVAESKAFAGNLQQGQNEPVKAKIWVDTEGTADLPTTVVTAAPVEETAAETTPTTTATVTAETLLPELMTLSTLRTVFEPAEMKSYSFGDLVVTSSFDLSTLGGLGDSTLDALPFLDTDTDAAGLGGLLDLGTADTSAPTSTLSEYRSFDSDALAFMSYLLGKSDDVEMITLGSEEIILIDSSAFLHGDTYVVSWATEDGSLISMVGLRSEFQQFDLIA